MNAVNTFLLEHNRQQSDFFLSSDEVARRALYRARHKSRIKVKKCMDGRVNVPAMTASEVPMGVIEPMRSMGGRFEPWSPNYAPKMKLFYEHSLADMMDKGTPGALDIITYHYSAGSHKLGCKGFGYDTDAARAYTAALKKECDRLYGPGHRVVHPIQMGIETDTDAFIFHGDSAGALLDMRDALEWSEEKLRSEMRNLYPEMRDGLFEDLMPFAIGNQRHVRAVLASKRPPAQLDHGEQIIGVGPGFDWLHIINKALIVGPYSVGWREEVAVAAGIVLSNFKEGRIPKGEGAVLLVSSPYSTPGFEAELAQVTATGMAREVWQMLKQKVPEIFDYNLELVVGTLDRNTMLMHRLNINPDLPANIG